MRSLLFFTLSAQILSGCGQKSGTESSTPDYGGVHVVSPVNDARKAQYTAVDIKGIRVSVSSGGVLLKTQDFTEDLRPSHLSSGSFTCEIRNMVAGPSYRVKLEAFSDRPFATLIGSSTSDEFSVSAHQIKSLMVRLIQLSETPESLATGSVAVEAAQETELEIR